MHPGLEALLDLLFVHRRRRAQVDDVDARCQQRLERVDCGHVPILRCTHAALFVDVGDHGHRRALYLQPAQQVHLADPEADHTDT